MRWEMDPTADPIMVEEETIPSAPMAASIEIAGGRVFERLRRQSDSPRRYAPCNNSWVAVDRILFKGRSGLLFHRNHNCFANEAIQHDLLDRDLTAVGFEVLGLILEPDGQLDVITADCPGVRLRALVEAIRRSGATLPREAAWHIISRTAELCDAWREAGVEPLDTFVGFDGSLHLFPSMPACYDSEMPSLMLDEIWDCLLVDDSIPKLGQLLCAELPSSSLAEMQELRRALGRPLPPIVAPTAPPEVLAFLDGSRTTTDAAPVLASLTREYFPETYARHGDIHRSLGRDLISETSSLQRHVYRSPAADPGTWGREREARILGRIDVGAGPTQLRLAQLPDGTRFAIERVPVRAAQLRRFLRSTGRAAPPELASVAADATAVRVSFQLADAYARWIGRRLPTEEELCAAIPTSQRDAAREWTSSEARPGGGLRRGWWPFRWGAPCPPGTNRHEQGAHEDTGFRCVLRVD